MTKRSTGIFGLLVLTILLAAFTGSALAGNGNGNGNGAGQSANSAATPATQPAPQATAPGNSANAPGQQKKATPTASQQVTGRGGGSAAQNSPLTPGMKPTSATAKNPNHFTTAGARPDVSKRYGNGTTAAQIATSRGAAGSTLIYGPGNSQPHKVQRCPGGQWIDVHAMKNFSSARCSTGAQSKSSSTQQSSTQQVSTSHSVFTVSPTLVTPKSTATSGGVLGATVTATGSVQGAATSSHAQGGVLGALASAKQSSGPRGGVLGAVATVGHGTLPFTGFPIWAALAVAIALTVFGLALRQRARATV